MTLFEKQTDSELVYDGRIIKVYKDEVILPDGKSACRETVRHCAAAAVLPIDSEGNAILEKQFRYPVGRAVTEVPAGKAEAGEMPLECAKRELREECGITADTWIELGPMYSSPGFTDEIIWLFVARDLHETEKDPDEDEFIELEKVPFEELLEKVKKGTVMDSKTQICVLRAEGM